MTKRFAPATERNREPILDVLKRVLPSSGLVLEIASGTGEHAVAFAKELKGLTWQPSDPDEGARESIREWTEESGLDNVRPPLDLDVMRERWPIQRADAIVCINMLHIAPIEACEGLMRGARRLLAAGGVVVTYGPYKVNGTHTAESNVAFDLSLRERNRLWGVRDIVEVSTAAADYDIMLHERVKMPANNFALVWRVA